MTSNNQQDGKPFTLPVHLFNDPIALSTFLAENYPAETEVVAVSEENIQEMEAAAGFLMPDAYVDHWLEKGSIFFGIDDFVYALYCYNAEGVNGNNLYGFLTFWQNYKRRSFNLIEQEKHFFTRSFWVLAMIIKGEEMWMFATDPLGTVRSIHFSESLSTIRDEVFNQALLPVLEAKTSLRAFMSTEAYLAAVESPPLTESEDEAADDDDTEAIEKAETNAFLKKYGIKRVSYDEILTALNVDQLFDYWEEGAENTYAYNYENERDYFDNLSAFYWCDGDLHIDGDLEIPHSHIDLLVVCGNMTVNGKVAAHYGDATPYYVTGNTTVDYIDLGFFQKTLGQENIRYVASAWGRDDEAVHTMPFRSINAPYFFSWFYDLTCFEFAADTIITALYNEEELAAYETKNVLLAWHDYAYAFLPHLYYNVSESHYDELSIGSRQVYEALKNNEPVFQLGVTPEGVQLTREGLRLNKEGDAAGAYQYFKNAFTKSPGYYPAYYNAGKCLVNEKAYAQAAVLFAKGIAYTPEKLIYEVGCMEQAALCAVRTGEYDKAIEWAKMAVQKNESAAFSLRVAGEALIYQNKLGEAKEYLERSVAVKSIFTGNWLLGLIYHLQGEPQTAEQFYQIAVQKNSKAQPYALHTSLHYLYGDNVTIDWDIQKPASKVKDQSYWNQFFAEMLQMYGPDTYKKTGKFPLDWLAAKLNTIPEQYRSKEMLQALLDHKTDGRYDVDGQVIRYFKPELYTQAIILQAVKREGACEYKHIPAQFITAEVWENHPRGIDLTYVPAAQLTYELCLRAVAQHQYNYKLVPTAFRDERMNIALIAGGCLKPYAVKELPSKYYNSEYIKQAIELGIQVIGNIPVKLVDAEVYDHAAGMYGQQPEWPLIVKQYQREGHQFTYDTFDKVWACFWDEAFIIKALTVQ